MSEIIVREAGKTYPIKVNEVGRPGSTGESAYLYAIRTGKFVGTEEEWYISLTAGAAAAIEAQIAADAANQASDLANQSSIDANLAATDAANSAISANSAATAANQASQNANQAASAVGSAVIDAEAAALLANEKAILADNAAQSANNAAQLANQEAAIATAAALAANNSATATNATKDAANLAATNANDKATLANSAATSANNAAALASNAVAAANAARDSANNAATLANQRAGEANTAAITANNAATSANNAALSITTITLEQVAISGTVVATEAMKNKVLIVTANTIFTISNTILSKDWTVRIIVKNGTFEFRKGTTRVWSTGNPDPILEKDSDFSIRQEGATSNLLVSGKFVSNPFIGYFDTKSLSPGSTNEKSLMIQFAYSTSPMYIDWGDGTQEYISSVNFATQFQNKVYAEAGAKMVKIWSNDFSFAMGLNTYTDRLKAVKFLNYGNMYFGLSSFFTPILFEETNGVPKFRANSKSMLSVYSGTKINNLEFADFSVITDLSFAFRFSAFNQKIGNLNVSNVTNFDFFMNNKTATDYSAENYDNLLNGWTERSFVPNKAIPFGTIKHTALATASKALMTRPYTLKPITNAVNNGSGLIRVTALLHGLTTGNKVFIRNVVGGMGANRAWNVTVIDVNTIDLIGSTYTTAYESGGEIVTGWGLTITDGGI